MEPSCSSQRNKCISYFSIDIYEHRPEKKLVPYLLLETPSSCRAPLLCGCQFLFLQCVAPAEFSHTTTTPASPDAVTHKQELYKITHHRLLHECIFFVKKPFGACCVLTQDQLGSIRGSQISRHCYRSSRGPGAAAPEASTVRLHHWSRLWGLDLGWEV